MQRRTRLAMLAVVSTATLIAGCGSSSSGGATGGSVNNNSSQPPSAELTSAVSALSHTSTLTAELDLAASASQISALASSTGGSISPAVANALSGAKVSIEVVAPSGKTLSDLSATTASSAGSAVDFTLSDNGTNFLSIRSVSKVLYVQADLKDLLTTFGQGQAYAQLQGASGLPSFVQALVQGKWISLPESAASALTGGSSSSGAGNPQQEQAIISGLKNILTKDVTVTRTSTGSTDKLSLSANSRTVVSDFVRTIGAAVPSVASTIGGFDPSSVPSKNITLGAQVTGGALSQLSIDLGQFTKGGSPLPLDLNLARSGPAITAPSGAVAVNTQELAQLLSSFAGGGLGSSTG